MICHLIYHLSLIVARIIKDDQVLKMLKVPKNAESAENAENPSEE